MLTVLLAVQLCLPAGSWFSPLCGSHSHKVKINKNLEIEVGG